MKVRPLALAVTLGVFAASAAGCASISSIDVTSQAFPVTFRNDTARGVVITACDDRRCTHLDSDYSDSLKAGAATAENMSDQNLLTRWIVRDRRSGTVLGCLPLRFQHKLKHAVVSISQAVPCPGERPIAASTRP